MKFYIDKGKVYDIYKQEPRIAIIYEGYEGKYCKLEESFNVFSDLKKAKNRLKSKLLWHIDNLKEQLMNYQVYHDKLEDQVSNKELIEIGLLNERI